MAYPPRWLGLSPQNFRTVLTTIELVLLYHGGMAVLLSFLSYALDKDIWWVQVTDFRMALGRKAGRGCSIGVQALASGGPRLTNIGS